jgi:hypothetical protein
VPGLIEVLFTEANSELLTLLNNEESEGSTLELVTRYTSTYPDTSGHAQYALIQLYNFLIAQQPVVSLFDEQSGIKWADALLKVHPENLIKLYTAINTIEQKDHKKLYQSLFNDVLLANLKDAEQIEYISLMIIDEQARAHFQAHPHVFKKSEAFRLYMAKAELNSQHDLIKLLNTFKDYPIVQIYLASSAESFSICKTNPQYYVDLIKAHTEQGSDSNNVVPLIKLAHLINQFMPQHMTLWRSVFLTSTPEAIRKMYTKFTKELNATASKSFLQEVSALINNQELNLNEQEKISYCKLIMDLPAHDIESFKKLTSLLNAGAFSLSALLERLKIISLPQLLHIIKSVPDSTLACDLLFGHSPIAQIESHIIQQSEAYKAFIGHYANKHSIDKQIMTQFIELYHFLHKNADADKCIWHSILLEANPTQIDKLHGWMSHYKQDNKLLILNLVFSKAHQFDFDKMGFKEETFIKDTEKLLTQPTKAFALNQPFRLNMDRVRLIHHLEKKTFVVPETTTIKGLWTGLKNSYLLKIIYDAYSRFMTQIKNNKAELLLVAKELTAIPDGGRAVRINRELKADLGGVVSNYLHSFWIRTQRKNSARSLLNTINKQATSYPELLNAIQSARNEVFTNDTEKERGMHRFGSSRYYQTLNQLEETLISHWVQDKNAIADFKRYLNHYKSTLSHSKQCVINAIQHENKVNIKDYNEDTAIDKLPGYIIALKKEVQLREDTYEKYEQLLQQSTVDEPTATSTTGI